MAVELAICCCDFRKGEGNSDRGNDRGELHFSGFRKWRPQFYGFRNGGRFGATILFFPMRQFEDLGLNLTSPWFESDSLRIAFAGENSVTLGFVSARKQCNLRIDVVVS